MTEPENNAARSSPWRTFLRTFIATWLLVMTEGVVVAGVSYAYFRGEPIWIAVIAAVLALAEAFVAAGVLGLKRAVIRAMIDAIRTWRLGSTIVRKLCDRLVGTSDAGEPGLVASGLQKVPMAEVERRLTGAVRGALGTSGEVADSPAGRLRKRLEVRVLALTAKLTLARFRADDAAHGGVDIAKVRAELEPKVDDLIADKLSGGLWLWTIAVLIGLPFVVAAQTWLALALLKMK